jgi:uncharacterized membrane protein YccF (DUF307 family)
MSRMLRTNETIARAATISITGIPSALHSFTNAPIKAKPIALSNI